MHNYHDLNWDIVFSIASKYLGDFKESAKNISIDADISSNCRDRRRFYFYWWADEALPGNGFVDEGFVALHIETVLNNHPETEATYLLGSITKNSETAACDAYGD